MPGKPLKGGMEVAVKTRLCTAALAAILLASNAHAIGAEKNAAQAQVDATNRSGGSEEKDAEAVAPAEPAVLQQGDSDSRATVDDKDKGKTRPIIVDGQAHQVIRGDTMWDLSGQYWNNKWGWPKMWSYNPQVRNPHWIYPGDKLFLTEPPPPAQPAPIVREIELVVEKLTPPVSEADAKKAAEAAKSAARAESESKVKASEIGLVERRAQDFLSAERPPRLGIIRNALVMKHFSAETEEVEIKPRDNDSLKVGDKLTIFDDSREIIHPATRARLGVQVRILGHLEVLRTGKDGTWGRIIAAYDTVEDGQGLMAYREPVTRLVPTVAPKSVAGMVVGGSQTITLFTSDDVVFLDKGSEDGLAPGHLVEVPLSQTPGSAEGYTDKVDKPIAKALVVSTQAKTSAAYITESRKAVEAGFRFTASADSP